jgi:thiamine biosynthesis lipoprotein
LFLTSCSEQVSLQQQQFYIFGTLVNISLSDVTEEQANNAMTILVQDLQVMHNNWHAWHPSNLTKLNTKFFNQQVATIENDNDLLELIKLAKIYATQSNNLFNPAIGSLIKLWGFQEDDIVNRSPPTADKINKLLLLNPTMSDINIDDKNKQIYSKNHAVKLDFGAFAKGYAVDLAIKKLKALNINNAIVNAGGNLKVIGKRGDRKWSIGIKHPNNGILAAIKINDNESVITSGDYERYYEFEGIKYSHLIDPRIGKPTISEFSSVTVIDKDATRADAATTALLIAGKKDWYKIAQQMQIKFVIILDKTGNVYVNPKMAKRIEFQSDQIKKIIITKAL